ncbi:GPR1/FUN34/yaaH family-domain-containing protein [Cunninghamella echinulata]|nr:GPR1/FUN34/yaaH family-domain-containing protein [Cunninghamella echinulata]
MSTFKKKTEYEHHETIDMIPSHFLDNQTKVLSFSPVVHPPLFKPGNPAVIGLSAFAVGSLVLGIYSTGLVTHLPQVVIGVALGFAGISQFVSGIFELIIGNTFAATTMLTYSGFFFTLGLTFSPATGFLKAVMVEGKEALDLCIGTIMLGYAVVSILFFLGTLRQPIIFRILLFEISAAFLLSSLGGFLHMHILSVAGGWVSIAIAITGWYIMCALLYNEKITPIKVPMF